MLRNKNWLMSRSAGWEGTTKTLQTRPADQETKRSISCSQRKVMTHFSIHNSAVLHTSVSLSTLSWRCVRGEASVVSTATVFSPPQERVGRFPSHLNQVLTNPQQCDTTIHVHSLTGLLVTYEPATSSLAIPRNKRDAQTANHLTGSDNRNSTEWRNEGRLWGIH